MKPPRQTIRFFDHLAQHDAAVTPADHSAPKKRPELTLMELLVNAEWRISVLEHVIDKLIASLPTSTIDEEDLESWREAGFAELQLRYPTATLTKTKPDEQ